MKITRGRRLFAMLVAVVLVMAQGTVFAEGAISLGANGLCIHTHNEDCGYNEKADCTHTCGESCSEGCVHVTHGEDCEYTQATPCTHEHTSDCGTLIKGETGEEEPSGGEETSTASSESGGEETSTKSPEPSVEETPTASPEPTEDKNPDNLLETEPTEGDGLTLEKLQIETMNDLSISPFSEDEAKTGDCTWSFESGTLTISGPGAMGNYTYSDMAPWYDEHHQSITAVVIGPGVTNVGSYAFFGHPALNMVTLSNSVTIIGESAFDGCAVLASITIPSAVTDIDEFAFYGCSALNSITFLGNQPPVIAMGAFDSVAMDGGVNFPEAGLADYLAALAQTDLRSWTNPHAQGAGNCGAFNEEDVKWILKDNILTISGSGAMKDYFFGEAPWTDYATTIETVVVDNGVDNVGSYAFMGCSALTTLTLGSSVTTIGESAFADCSSLDNVTIPQNATTIGDFAFMNCHALGSITIPDGVSTLGWNTFDSCENLSTLIIGEGVTYIANSAFGNCTSLTNITFKSITPPNIEMGAFTGGTANEGSLVTLPATLALSAGVNYLTILEQAGLFGWANSLNITAFGDCSDYVTPDTVKWAFTEEGTNGTLTIFGWGAMADNGYPPWFSYIDKITNIVIENGVTSIGNSAFANCTSLTGVTIGEDVNTIGECAFMGCASLTSIAFNGVIAPTISQSAFEGVPYSDTSQITLPQMDLSGELNYLAALAQGGLGDWNNSLNITEFGDCGASPNTTALKWVFKNDGTLAIYGQGAMEDYALGMAPWSNLSITKVIIENGVTAIGENAFAGCNNLNSITMGEGITTIGANAFNGCTSLSSLTMGEGITTIGANAFSGCTGLNSLTMGEGVTNIGKYAFDGCSELKNITFNGATPPQIIGAGAFARVYPNGSLNFPVEGLMEYLDCLAVTNLKNWSNNHNITATNYCGAGDDKKAVKWTLKSNGFLTISGTGAMVDYAQGTAPWYNRHRGSIMRVEIETTVTNIGAYAFEGCTNLNKVTINEEVTQIGDGAFYGCTNLGTLSIPNSVTKIGGSAFYGCAKLDTLSIPNNVTDIGPYAFYGCTKLTGILIPSNVTVVSEGVFAASGLTAITIPEGVTKIKKSAFENCAGLAGVTFKGALPPTIEAKAFAGVNAADTNLVTFPKNNIVEYITALAETGVQNWTYEGIIAQGECGNLDSKKLHWILDESGIFTIIGEGEMVNYGYQTAPWHSAYRGEIKEVIVKEGVTHIGDYAFYECYAFTNITIPEGTATIGNHAFGDCSNLSTAALPNSVTTIGKNAFENCTDLLSVTIPNGETKIGQYAFSNCSSLAEITIPGETTTIEMGTFAHCSGLTEITIPNKVTTIDNLAFANCGNLESITIPKSVTIIGDLAFSGSSELKNVTFKGLTPPTMALDSFFIGSAGEPGFVTLPAIEALGFRGAVDYAVAMDGMRLGAWANSLGVIKGGYCGAAPNEKAVYWILHDSGLLTISGEGKMAGYGERNRAPWYENYHNDITEVVIENGVTNVGDWAFKDCSRLIATTIADSVETIGEKAFSNCAKLANATFTSESQLEIIDFSAFSGCTSLANIVIPDSVETIGIGAFSGCTSLANIAIPDSVETIGTSAFGGCSSLATITIPEGVTIIGIGAFASCTNLASITISDGVPYIADRVFLNCTSLTTITFKGAAPPSIKNSTFGNVPNVGTIYYPKGAEGAYNQNWLNGLDDSNNIKTWTLDTFPLDIVTNTVNRTSVADATVAFTSDGEGQYTYRLVAYGEPEPTLPPANAKGRAQGWEPLTPYGLTTITLNNLATNAPWDLWIFVKDRGGNTNSLKVEIPGYPTLTATATALAFDPQPLGTTGTKTLTLGGEYLTGDISYQLSDDYGIFTVAQTSWNNATGGTLTVTFAPVAVQSYSTNITIRSNGADNVVVSLTGEGQKAIITPSPVPTATPTPDPVTYCTVDFYSDNTLYTTRTVAKGENLAAIWPQSPTKANYTFGGWYTQPNGAGQGYTSGTAITTSVNLYAKWVYTGNESPIPGAGDEGPSLLLWLVTMILTAGIALITITHRWRRQSSSR